MKDEKTKEERQAERQAQREERQAQRKEHREYVKENGTAIGNEFRALGKGLKEDWQNDVNALKGRRSGASAEKPATDTKETAPKPTAPPTPATAPANSGKIAGVETPDFNAIKKEMNYDPNAPIPPKTTEKPATDTKETAPKPTAPPTDTGYVAYNKGGANYDGAGEYGDDYNGLNITKGAMAAGQTDAETEEEIQEWDAAETEELTGQDGQNGNTGTQRTSQGQSETITIPRGWTAPYEKYNPDDDPYVQSIRKANETLENEYLGKPVLGADGKPEKNPDGSIKREGGILSDFDSLVASLEQADKQRTQKDASNAFWRGIGEVGASLVNLLGVSGAFGGKNAYGRGAYSSMQKFDLTTEKLTDKMKADMDKRKERMDALRQKQKELGLQWAALKSKGIEAEGKAAHEGAEKVAERNLKLNQLRETRSNSEWTRVGADGSITSGRNGGGKWTKDNAPVTFKIGKGKNGQGQQGAFVIQKGILNEAIRDKSGELANAIARELGYNNGYSQFEREMKAYGGDTERKYTAAIAKATAADVADTDPETIKDGVDRLIAYEKLPRLGSITGNDQDVMRYFQDWVYAYGEYYAEFGNILKDYLIGQGYLNDDGSNNSGGSGGSTGNGGGTGSGGSGGSTGNGGGTGSGGSGGSDVGGITMRPVQ